MRRHHSRRRMDGEPEVQYLGPGSAHYDYTTTPTYVDPVVRSDPYTNLDEAGHPVINISGANWVGNNGAMLAGLGLLAIAAYFALR